MPRRTDSFGDSHALFDLVSYGRRGPGRITNLSPAHIAQVARTVRRTPEVMVKVSGGGTTPKAVIAHFKYLNRRPEFEIETDDANHLRGRESIKSLVDGWDLDLDAAESRSYRGTPGRKPAKLVHNIVLSMPKGVAPNELLKASVAFAREQFALKHRYAMVLHTDKDHPHVHLVVKAMGDDGTRLNIRKATLREWRREFARHLREHGIAANATDRVIRGVAKSQKRDGIYRADADARSSHMDSRRTSVKAELITGNIRPEAGKAQILLTRGEIERGWRAVSDALRYDRQHELAAQVDRFLKEMPYPQSEREWIAAELPNKPTQTLARERPSAR
jgi:hypothetical protein